MLEPSFDLQKLEGDQSAGVIALGAVAGEAAISGTEADSLGLDFGDLCWTKHEKSRAN